MTPWAVSPRAGCSKASSRSARASILQAPSSTEYSECTWRWTQVTASRIYGRRPTARPPFFAQTGFGSVSAAIGGPGGCAETGGRVVAARYRAVVEVVVGVVEAARRPAGGRELALVGEALPDFVLALDGGLEAAVGGDRRAAVAALEVLLG